MTIKNWPNSEGPREKLLSKGAQSLSDAELLAIFLRTGTRGQSAVEMGRRLLRQYKSLSNLLTLPQKELCKHKGLGETKYVQLQATLEIARRYLEESLRKGDVVNQPQTTKNFLYTQLRDSPNEQFACLFLDSQYRVIEFEIMFKGSINQASVHPRVVMQRSLYHNAAAVIFAHNHPSGLAEPSDADIQVTQQLKEVLALIDVKVLDHIIIGHGQIQSLAELGEIL